MPISSLRASPAVHQTWKDHLPHWSQISYITSQMFSCWRITCEELWSSLFQENFYNQMVHPCWGNDKDNKPLKKIPSFTRHTVFVKTKEKKWNDTDKTEKVDIRYFSCSTFWQNRPSFQMPSAASAEPKASTPRSWFSCVHLWQVQMS